MHHLFEIEFHPFFFQALMVKKVKTYLNNAEITTDEKRLEEIANQCEPGMINRSD